MFLPFRLRGLQVALLLLLSASATIAHAGIPAGGIAEFATRHDCFEKFPSYDAWMDFLWSKNNAFAYLMIKRKFSRADFERYRSKLECHAIRYRSDGHLVPGWLVVPRGKTGRKLPVVIYNRGGNRTSGALTFSHLFHNVFPLAEQGYMVAVSQYRGVLPVSGEIRSPDEFGGADVNDVHNLLRIVVRLPRADARNVFMIGEERGAIMVFRSLLDSPVPIRAAAIYSGVYDLHALQRFRPEFKNLYSELIPAYSKHARTELDRRSVVKWPASLPESTALLLVHSAQDERTPIESARRFDAQLTALGRPHKSVFDSRDGYLLDGRDNELLAETVSWFRRHQSRAAVELADRR